MHANRAAAERCGVLLGGALQLVRLDEVRPAVYHVAWSLSAAACGRLRRRATGAGAELQAAPAGDTGPALHEAEELARGGTLAVRSSTRAFQGKWRYWHLKMVQRTSGTKTGAGGSSGADRVLHGRNPTMPKQWHQAVDEVRPYVVKIETKSGWGTGFYCVHMPEYNWIGIATASHVIEAAISWEEPIKLHCQDARPVILNPRSEWIPVIDPVEDSAIIVVVDSTKLDLPGGQLRRVASNRRISEGVEVGWVGYPTVHTDLCFFSGRISAYDAPRERYLLDGTSIPGVSGGPVFLPGAVDGPPRLIGSITGYKSPSGSSTPGLCVANEFSKAESLEQRLRNVVAEFTNDNKGPSESGS